MTRRWRLVGRRGRILLIVALTCAFCFDATIGFVTTVLAVWFVLILRLNHDFGRAFEGFPRPAQPDRRGVPKKSTAAPGRCSALGSDVSAACWDCAFPPERAMRPSRARCGLASGTRAGGAGGGGRSHGEMGLRDPDREIERSSGEGSACGAAVRYRRAAAATATHSPAR
jgi:hypothetical protein